MCRNFNISGNVLGRHNSLVKQLTEYPLCHVLKKHTQLLQNCSLFYSVFKWTKWQQVNGHTSSTNETIIAKANFSKAHLILELIDFISVNFNI